ncbi:MAG: hypothetical protein IJJ94_09105 [Bacteroidaceae bacterium]|nr:hypothetical protein [Bacteroidaceae bacterium]
MIYLIKWAFALTLFYSLYGLTLRRETFHTLNRAVLLVILVVSAVLPLCPIPLGHETWLSQGFERLEQMLTTNQVVSEEQAKQPTDIDSYAGETIHTDENIQSQTSFHHDGTIIPSSQNDHSIMMERSTRPVSSRWSTIVLRLFVLTTAAFWLVYLRSLIGVVRLIRRSSLIEERDGARILSCPELKNSCSWMRWVLVAEAGEESSGKEFSSILTHELAHVRLGHSWDKLLCELTCRTLWWLPFAWMLREDMTDVHEFEADRAVLRTGIDIRAYNQLLILKAVRPGLQPVVNAFNQSRIKKRITMMFKPKSNKWRAAKVLYLLPVMALTLVAFAKPNISQKEKTLTIPPLDIDINATLKEDSIYDYVDIPAHPNKVGDEAWWIEWVATHTITPEEAANSESQEGAFVAFIIEKDGSVGTFTILRSSNCHLSDQILRSLPPLPGNWVPAMRQGKPVRQRLIMHILRAGKLPQK